MIKKIVFLLLIVQLAASCETTKKSTSADGNEKATLLISYAQSAKNSTTEPEYSIELYSNKQMYLNGIRNIDKTGKYMRTLSDKEFNSLIQSFNDANFFDFKDEYTSDAPELLTRYVYFFNDGKEKKVKDYYGAPESLKELEYSIQSFLDRVGWEKLSW
ncbi:MAG: DUF6438 domain-containing protein [Salinivirgaceae bacterium]